MRRRLRQESKTFARMEARLRDAADFVPAERIPEGLVEQALAGIGESTKLCRERTLRGWAPRFGTAMLLLGALTIGIRIASNRHTTVSPNLQNRSSSLAQHGVAPPEVTPLPKNAPLTSAKLSPIIKETAHAGKQSASITLPTQTPSGVHRTVRRPVVALKAIWHDEVVQSDQQGVVVPVITARYDPVSDQTDVTHGVAIVPVHSRVTTCVLSPEESDSTDAPISDKER